MKKNLHKKIIEQIDVIERITKTMGKKTRAVLWDIEDLHAFSKIPKSTIKFYVKRAMIPSIKVGRHRRFIPKEIKAWLKERAQA